EMAHVLAEHVRELATVARYFVDNGQRREYEDIQHELDESLAASVRLNDVSVRQEIEADYIGFTLGAESGVAPEARLSLVSKLRAQAAAPLLATHPSGDERMNRARGMLPVAQRIFARSLAPSAMNAARPPQSARPLGGAPRSDARGEQTNTRPVGI